MSDEAQGNPLLLLKEFDTDFSPSTNPENLELFVDIDNTLIIGTPDEFNDDLINAMVENGIKEIYLCSSMAIKDAFSDVSEIDNINRGLPSSGRKSRDDLVKYLGEKGIKVKGVLSTADLHLIEPNNLPRLNNDSCLAHAKNRFIERVITTDFGPEKSKLTQDEIKTNAALAYGKVWSHLKEFLELYKDEPEFLVGQTYETLIKFIKSKNLSSGKDYEQDMEARALRHIMESGLKIKPDGSYDDKSESTKQTMEEKQKIIGLFYKARGDKTSRRKALMIDDSYANNLAMQEGARSESVQTDLTQIYISATKDRDAKALMKEQHQNDLYPIEWTPIYATNANCSILSGVW